MRRKHLRLALFALACLAPLGCSKDPAQLVATATELEAKGDLQGARVSLRSAVQLSPDDGALRYRLGQLSMRLHDPASANNEFQKALALGTQDEGRVDVLLARAQLQLGKFEELAQRSAGDAAWPADVRASLTALRGRAQRALDQADAAAESLAQAKELDAANPDALLLDAQVLASDGRFDEADQLLAKLLEKHPDNYEGWLFTAEIARLRQQPEAALAAYDRALELYTNSLVGLLRRSALRMAAGDLDGAEQDVKSLMSRYADVPDAAVRAGMLHLERGDPRAALDSAQMALSKAPAHPPATLLAGLAHYRLGALSQAEEYLRRAVASTPSNRTALKALASIFVQTRNNDGIIDVIEPRVAQGVPDPQLMSVVASARLAKGDSSAAMKWFERAAQAKPDDLNLQVQRAFATMTADGVDSGLDDLQSIVDEGPEAGVADEILVMTMLRAGRKERAAEAVEKLVARAPDSPTTHNLVGLVRYAEGKRDPAQDAFRAALKADPAFLSAAKNLVMMEVAAGRTDVARQILLDATKAAPKSAEAWLALATFEVKVGDAGKAVDALDAAARLLPATVEDQTELVTAYLQAGDPAKAEAAALAALDTAPNDARILGLALTALAYADNKERLVEVAQHLVDVAPGDSQAVLRAADLLLARELPEKAEAVIRQALKTSPKSAGLNVALVSLLVRAKNFAGAESAVEELKTQQPNGPLARLLNGEVHEAQGNFLDAIEAYRQALRMQPVGQFAVKLFVARGRAGEGEAALQELAEWVDANAKDTVARTALGDALLATGDLAGAAKHYAVLIDNKAATADVANKLAWLYHLQGGKEKLARDTAELAVRLAPESGVVLDTLGWMLVEQGEVQKGLETLRRAAYLAPREPEVIYHLAAALARDARPDDARKILAILLDAKVEFPSRKDAESLLASLK